MMKGYVKKRSAMKDDEIPLEQSVIISYNENGNDRQRMIGKDIHVQTELTANPLDDVEMSVRRRVVLKDADVQTDLTAITFNNEEIDFRWQLVGKDIDVKSISPGHLHSLQMDMVTEEAFDQNQVAVITDDSNTAAHTYITKNRRIVDATTEEPNLTTTSMVNDIKADLGPIMGYAAEPLLPLSKACSALNNILYNLPFYVQKALDETPEQPLDGLTIDESAAIRLYTIEWKRPHRSLYSMLNYTLKNDDREHLRPYFKYMKLLLVALAKLPCAPPSICLARCDQRFERRISSWYIE